MQIALLTCATLLISAAGGLGLTALGMPAGMLMGGALAVVIATFLGFKSVVPNKLRDVLFVCVGLSMGANVAPDTLSLMGQWPITLFALAVELVVIVIGCGFLLTWLFRMDKGTAYLSSFPGHLSVVVALASTGVGDARQITVIQVQRVLLLTLAVPIGAIFLPVGNYTASVSEVMPLSQLALVALGCTIVGFIFSKLKIPAGYVLGSMLFATAMRLSGNFDGALPPLLVDATFIGIGGMIGARFRGVERQALITASIGGMVATGFTIAVVTLIAYGLTFVVDMPFGQLWLGLSPGGLESMGALGIALGYDTAFIAAHHVFRLTLLIFAIPTAAFLLRTKESPA